MGTPSSTHGPRGSSAQHPGLGSGRAWSGESLGFFSRDGHGARGMGSVLKGQCGSKEVTNFLHPMAEMDRRAGAGGVLARGTAGGLGRKPFPMTFDFPGPKDWPLLPCPPSQPLDQVHGLSRLSWGASAPDPGCRFAARPKRRVALLCSLMSPRQQLAGTQERTLTRRASTGTGVCMGDGRASE